MPAILVRLLLWLMTSFAGQLLFSLGLGLVSYSALTSLFGWLEASVANQVSSLPKNILIAMKLLHADIYISIILSAYAIKATITAAQVAFKRSS